MVAVAQAAESLADALSAANLALSQFSFTAPQATFRRLRSEFSVGSDDWQQVTYGLASCLAQESSPSAEQIAESHQLYGELAKNAGDTAFARRALLCLARLKEVSDYHLDPLDPAGAREHYREVMRRWPDSSEADEAALRCACNLIATNERAQATQGTSELTAWAEGHPQSPLAAGMWHVVGDAQFMLLNDDAAALAAYRKADAIGLLWRGREWMVWWRMAVLAERVGDRDDAVTWYTRICTDAQTSGKAFEAQLALARLGAPVPELISFTTYAGPTPAAQP